MIAYKRHLNYLRYVIRHKWFVFQECLRLGGVPIWNAIFHDWSKFLPDEWIPYAFTFYTWDGADKSVNPALHRAHDDFDTAWLHHQHRNKHHWQYWVLVEDDGGTKVLPMPDVYRREMLADWRGAGRAITGKDNTRTWYAENRDNIQLHPETRQFVDTMLHYVPRLDFIKGLIT